MTEFDGTSFSYNGQGRRIAKGEISYTCAGDGRIIKENDGASRSVEYVYDGDNVIGFIHGELYLYRKNAQGDVIGILDKRNTLF